MKKYALHFATILCAVLILVTVTFAWMLGEQHEQRASRFGLDYGHEEDDHILTVVSQELSFEVLVQDTKGEYEPFETYTFDEAVPGRTIPFEVRFYNNAPRKITIDLSLSGIQSKKVTVGAGGEAEETPFIKDGQTLIHHTFVSLMGDGDVFQSVSPVEEYKCLGDGLEGIPDEEEGYSLILVPSMQIPVPEEEGTPYILHCYFLVDGSVDSEFQGVTLEIGSFIAAIH